MDNDRFESLRSEFALMMRSNPRTCPKGYSELCHARSFGDISRIIRLYWADLNHALWPEFQALMQCYYSECASELRRYDIYYNEPCSRGRCIADAHCPTGRLEVKGTAQVVAHDRATIVLRDQAQALMLDSSHAIARSSARVDARDASQVEASEFSHVRAFDNSRITSSGPTEIFLYDHSQLSASRVRRVVNNSSSTYEPAKSATP